MENGSPDNCRDFFLSELPLKSGTGVIKRIN
jgi:hypothetical protein